jgi:hypothetical protein
MLELFPQWRGELPLGRRTARARSKLRDENPGLAETVATYPLAEFDALHRAQPVQPRYRYVSPALRRFMVGIPAEFGPAWLCELVLWYIDNAEARSDRRLPPEFKLHFNDSFHRIIDQIEAGTGFADFYDDVFMKDLRISQQTIIPAVAQVLWPHLGFSLRSVLTGGWKTLQYFANDCGGLRGFIELHSHEPMIKTYFNPAGWEETYRLMSLLCAARPDIRGVGSISWYYDPQVSSLSPRLAYLQARPISLGAHSFYFNSSAEAVAAAIATSPTRRTAFEAGRFQPKNYALVWSRDAVLRHDRDP